MLAHKEPPISELLLRVTWVLRAGSNVHLLLKNGGSSEPKPTATVTEIAEGEEAPAEAPATEEKAGSTSEIIPLATRTKEGMAALVKVIQGLPGEVTTLLASFPA